MDLITGPKLGGGGGVSGGSAKSPNFTFFFFFLKPSLISEYDYEHPGSAPSAFFGQNHNQLIIFTANPICKGSLGFLPN